MRRKDKEIVDRVQIDKIIEEAEVFRLAMVKDSVPYILLLNFGYDRKNIFFHSAKEGRKEGRKIDFLTSGDVAYFEMELEVTINPHKTRGCS